MKPGGFSERIWEGRWSRAGLTLLVFLILATIIPAGPRRPMEGGGEAPLIYTPVTLAADDPGFRQLGRLYFVAGWSLSSPDDRFGGLSGLHVEGGQATAISDAGMVMTFPLPGTAPAPRVRFQPVEQGPGPNRQRLTRDTEGLWIEGDRLWLTYERQNAIWRYDRASLAGQSEARPPLMRRWRGNSGAEAIVRLADGRFLIIEEGRDNGAPTSQAVLFAGDPSLPETPSAPLIYRRPSGYRATDATLLPDGRILILNRGLSWLRLSAKLLLADPRQLRPGGTIEGQEIATLEAPLTVDNMEGVSVTQEHGRTIVWLVSDDDFMRMFRHTLLLKFELRL